jgi:hypothetical protein
MFTNSKFLIFPEYVCHNTVSINQEKVKSAGFVSIYKYDGEYKVECYGESGSLGIKSNINDSVIIKRAIENY